MTHPAPSALLSAALQAAERGWHVFPLRPRDKRPALHGETACPGTGDCAAGHRKWEQRATTDPDRIRKAWSAGPFNVGLATGPSGLVVVDLDPVKAKDLKGTPDGVTSLQALCERAGHPVPATYRTRTASGGYHLYFTAPGGVRLGNSAGRLGKHIDTRAHGGYVVSAGSFLPSGAYDVVDSTEPVPLPEWLYALLTPRQPPRGLTAAPVPERASRYAAAALRAETTAVAGAGEGVRNWTLVRAARALGRFIPSGDLARSEVEAALNSAGLRAGLRENECRAAVASALNWSIANNPGRPA
ncbi:bifunctional DNA primase/polymerase [Streptomyces sp. ISL-112]|uniref:bifunctional DNA primase/polymerase n=1 Tax=unclassified Streptomyces TaxID=2593676 RepID=UPI001BEB5152|nr:MULTISPECIES: bifunctional DNA primase/polymerase [unclassified Streptomyces]MBT2424409.1 bifunctional DNA primase/polymerase [Streptomyces sp. ISL-112]MBT2464944.1 bifunctional DNA primase/polymerase [Streptomyces sp. ISL-63]